MGCWSFIMHGDKEKCNESLYFITFFCLKNMSEIHFSTLYYHAKRYLSTFWTTVQRVLMVILEIFICKMSKIWRILKISKRFSLHRRQNSSQIQ